MIMSSKLDLAVFAGSQRFQPQYSPIPLGQRAHGYL